MTNLPQEAKILFGQGYNCAQAILGASCDATGMDKETALKAGAPLGGGMGRMREVCGAVTGMFLAAGLLCGVTDPKDREGQAAHYKLIREMADEFEKRHSSILCRELLASCGHKENNSVPGRPESHVPDLRTESYYRERPCTRLVESAAEILEKLIQSKTLDQG